MSVQLVVASHAMPPTNPDLEEISEEIIDPTNMAPADGNDPIIWMRDAMSNGSRQKVLCNDLWNMVSLRFAFVRLCVSVSFRQ